jgi:hypothetical protein
MAKVTDHRSFHGKTGALTVVADVYSVFAPTYRPRFFFFRYIFRAPYRQVESLEALFAFRWSLVRFPGSPTKSLIFETVFYGDWSQYLRVLVAGAGGGVDVHALGSIGYPTVGNVEVFLDYLNQHHRPAIHVFAKDPDTSPIRYHHKMKTSLPKARWFGAIFEIRPGFVGRVTDILESWNLTDCTSNRPKSPFNNDDIFHGRAVIVQHQKKSFLHISLVYQTSSAQGKRKFRALIRPSKHFLKEFLGKEGWEKWRDVLQLTIVGAKEKDKTIRSSEQMERIFLESEFGHRRIGYWVDSQWNLPRSNQ